jgi:hypothetical protein
MFMVSSKKTACVSVSMMTREVIARTPPPAFLFPINDVKDQDRQVAPTLPFKARSRPKRKRF